jgi:hypothetical protein
MKGFWIACAILDNKDTVPPVILNAAGLAVQAPTERGAVLLGNRCLPAFVAKHARVKDVKRWDAIARWVAP